jgi:archaellum component FlaC
MYSVAGLTLDEGVPNNLFSLLLFVWWTALRPWRLCDVLYSLTAPQTEQGLRQVLVVFISAHLLALEFVLFMRQQQAAHRASMASGSTSFFANISWSLFLVPGLVLLIQSFLLGLYRRMALKKGALLVRVAKALRCYRLVHLLLVAGAPVEDFALVDEACSQGCGSVTVLHLLDNWLRSQQGLKADIAKAIIDSSDNTAAVAVERVLNLAHPSISTSSAKGASAGTTSSSATKQTTKQAAAATPLPWVVRAEQVWRARFGLQPGDTTKLHEASEGLMVRAVAAASAAHSGKYTKELRVAVMQEYTARRAAAAASSASKLRRALQLALPKLAGVLTATADKLGAEAECGSGSSSSSSSGTCATHRSDSLSSAGSCSSAKTVQRSDSNCSNSSSGSSSSNDSGDAAAVPALGSSKSKCNKAAAVATAAASVTDLVCAGSPNFEVSDAAVAAATAAVAEVSEQAETAMQLLKQANQVFKETKKINERTTKMFSKIDAASGSVSGTLMQQAQSDAQRDEVEKQLAETKKDLTATKKKLSSATSKLENAVNKVAGLEFRLSEVSSRAAASDDELAAAVRAADSIRVELRALRKQVKDSRDGAAAAAAAHTAALEALRAAHAKAAAKTAAAHAKELAAVKAVVAAPQNAAAAAAAAVPAGRKLMPSCAVCLDADVQVMLQPCKHLILCSSCAALEDMLLCPVCRAVITDMDTVHM